MVSAPRRRLTAGFTLVELMVATVIIAFLLSLLLVSVGGARRSARNIQCLNNLREIGLAAQIFAEEYGRYPRVCNTTMDPYRRWMDQLKPYFEKKSSVYRCPSDFQPIPLSWDPEIVLSYGMNTCKFGHNNLKNFWDSDLDRTAVGCPATVILFADCTPGKYYCGTTYNVPSAFRHPVANVDYRHNNGSFNAAFCDGHAETRTETTQKDWDPSQ